MINLLIEASLKGLQLALGNIVKKSVWVKK